jgi:arginine-tRNA-protein transferase
MKYFLEDVMIAVGVADIFPEGFSSNYFFHDMKYRGLRLGVFSTLIEI